MADITYVDTPLPPDHPSTKSSVPNLESVIHDVRNSQAWDFTTKEGLCAYQNACVCALHAADANFGQLTKTDGQNHCVDPAGKNCATDVALYRPTGQIIDFIASAGYGTPPPPNDVCWIVGPAGEYGADSWFAPTNADGTTPDGGGGTGDYQAQLDRMEQKIIQMELYLSNMNAQLALQGGVVNQLYAETKLEGDMVRNGETLTLFRKQ